MNDNELQDELNQALGKLHRPAGLDERTLAYIREQNGERDAAGGESAKAHGAEEDATAKAIVLDQAVRATSTRKRRPRSFAVKAVAACLVLALAGLGSAGAYRTPVAFADVESSASVGLSVNCFDRVIAAEGLDEPGQAALDELAGKGVTLKGMPYAEALEAIAGTSGYSAADSPEIKVTVACNNQNRCQRMQQDADSCLRNRAHCCAGANVEEREAARAQGQGMHRYGQGADGAGPGAGNANGGGSGAGNANGGGSGEGLHDGSGPHGNGQAAQRSNNN